MARKTITITDPDLMNAMLDNMREVFFNKGDQVEVMADYTVMRSAESINLKGLQGQVESKSLGDIAVRFDLDGKPIIAFVPARLLRNLPG